MTSILKVDTLQNLNSSTIITQTNATTLTLGTSGQTISIPAGATINTSTINVTTVVLAAGAVGTPSLTTSGDTNTGIFFPSADTIAFTEGGTEAMRIDSSGNVGIGVTSPVTTSARFSVKATGDYDAGIAIGSNSSAANWARLDFKNTNFASPSIIYQDQSGNFSIRTDGAVPILFETNAAERMRIDSSGNVLVGTTSIGSNTSLFFVNGTIGSQGIRGRQGTNGTSNGNNINFAWTGSALQAWVDTSNVGDLTLSSDYRIKRNIETQTAPALERLMILRPVTYQRADYGTIFKADDAIKEGFIAHELAEVIPSAVEGEKDAENQIQSLRVDAILAVVVKAIQEQQAIIEELKATSTSQQTKIDSLEARLTALESN